MEKEAEHLTAFQNFSRESYNICLTCCIYFQFTKLLDVLKNNKISIIFKLYHYKLDISTTWNIILMNMVCHNSLLKWFNHASFLKCFLQWLSHCEYNFWVFWARMLVMTGKFDFFCFCLIRDCPVGSRSRKS